MKKNTVIRQKTLQRLYDDCNWYGYATYKGARIYKHEVLQLAANKNVKLEYNCPA